MIWQKYIDDKPSAWREHIQDGYNIVLERQPRVIVELGVHYGHSFFTFAQAVKDGAFDCVLYAVDNWTGDRHVGEYGEEVYELVERTAREGFPELDIRLVRGDFQEVAGKIRHKIDLLHIDGSHDYESVSKDWETYSKKLRDGAMILFHDIDVGGFGVRQLFNELRAAHPEWSFEEKNEGFGLGIIDTAHRGEATP